MRPPWHVTNGCWSRFQQLQPSTKSQPFRRTIRKTFGRSNFLLRNTKAAFTSSQNVVGLYAGQTSGIQLLAGIFKSDSIIVTLIVK